MQNHAIPNSTSCDLFKLAMAPKEVAGISANTLRKWNRQGTLRLYKCGKLIFASRSEVVALVKSQAGPTIGRPPRSLQPNQRQKVAA